MTFAHPLTWWVVVVLVAVALVLGHRTYAGAAVPLTRSQRRGLSGLRSVTLLLLVAFLMRPVVSVRGSEPRDAIVPVLVDVSRSMALEDADGQSRLAWARALVERRLLPALSGSFQVELLSFGDRLLEAALEDLRPVARRSDLGAALEGLGERYRGRTVAGVVVISDGGDTGLEDASQAVSDWPVFTVGAGARRAARDREVVSLTVGEAPVADSVVELATAIVSRGLGTAPLQVTVRENGRPIQVRPVTPGAGGSPVRVVFRVSPRHDSATVYTVEIPTDAEELTGDNNRRSVVVQPSGRRRRVLIVEGRPGFEHSFLKRALAGDSGLEVDAVVRKGQNDRGEDTFYVQAAQTRAAALVGGFPATRAALFAYDAVLLANVDASVFSRDQLELTAAFVAQRGGGLLVMGGRSFEQQAFLRTPIEEVVPVELTDRSGLAVRVRDLADAPGRVIVTPEGARHPVMQLGGSVEETVRRWAEAPPLAAGAALGGARAGATILAECAGPGGVTRPLIGVQRYGEGRAMAFAGEAAWRWKMLLPSDDHLYETFWRQAIRWLAGTAPDPVSLSVPTGGLPGDSLPLTVTARDQEFASVRDAALVMRVVAPGGIARELHATAVEGGSGGYLANFIPEGVGLHHVQVEARRGDVALGAAAADFLVGGVDEEMADPRLNDEVLRRLALASGGALLDVEDLAGLVDRLSARAPGRLPPAVRDVWHSAWSFLVVVMLLGTEWALRRRWGMR